MAFSTIFMVMMIYIGSSFQTPVKINGEAPGDECSLEIFGETHELEHIYVLRFPDPFDDNILWTRLVCTDQPLSRDDFVDNRTFISVFHADHNGGFFIDFDETGEPASWRLKWRETTSMASSVGALHELHVNGGVGAGGINAAIQTDPPLPIFQSEETWKASARVNQKPLTVWKE